MKQIILTRHTDNREFKDVGKKHNDYDLTKVGIKQAEEVQEFLKDKSFKAIFSSIYLRAIRTAEIVNRDKNVPIYKTNAFNEYYLRPDGKGVESTRMALARTLSKLYAVFDLFDDVLIVAHSSINQSIIQAILNMEYDKSLTYFNKFGETQILKYDYQEGDKNWRIVDAFVPKQ